MNFIKNSKGITLIALVITIIVLLILAGVSIKLIFGSEGLLGKATASVDTHNIGTAKEQVELKIAELKSEYYEKRYATAEIEIDVQSGDWIFNQCEGDTIDTENYQFTITLPTGKETADAENPYIVTILKSKKLPSKVTGTLSIDGILTWDENFLADSGDEGGNENPVEHGTTMESKGPITIGSVTYSDSYEIWNKSQLEDFRNKVNSGNKFENCIITQKADVSLSSVSNWTPIGNETNYFSGTYHGNNFKIEGLSIASTENYQGLFGNIKNGKISNLTVGGNVQGGAGSAGIVGYIMNGSIDNCINEANVTNSDNYITNVYYNTPYTFLGGISGLVEGTTQITNCSNSGTIEIKSTTNAEVLMAGGIVGNVNETENGVNIKKCSNTGEVKCGSINKENITHIDLGGIAGSIWGGTITQCSNTGKIYSIETECNITQWNIAGGIVGYLIYPANSETLKIDQCWNSGYIENSCSGGIVGISNACGKYTNDSSRISNCYNIGKVVSNYKCGGRNHCFASGGICSYQVNGEVITNCYNKGEIENNGCNFDPSVTSNIGCAGGIIGYNGGNIYNSYNTGKISALPSTTDERGSTVGGIMGVQGGDNTIIQNIYNTGDITVSKNAKTYIGGIVGWNRWNKTISNSYNIGLIDTNALYKGGVVGYWESSTSTAWTNFYWLQDKGATVLLGNNDSNVNGKSSSSEIKSLISDGGLPSTDWVTSSNINNGYPHLKVFDDTSIWLRNSAINDGDPYLKNNPPV